MIFVVHTYKIDKAYLDKVQKFYKYVARKGKANWGVISSRGLSSISTLQPRNKRQNLRLKLKALSVNNRRAPPNVNLADLNGEYMELFLYW